MSAAGANDLEDMNDTLNVSFAPTDPDVPDALPGTVLATASSGARIHAGSPGLHLFFDLFSLFCMSLPQCWLAASLCISESTCCNDLDLVGLDKMGSGLA